MIKILGKDYQVNFVDNNSFNPGNMGAMEFSDNRITILEGMSKEQTNETILHEILHAIDISLGTNLGEKRVTSLSSVIYSVLKENGVKIDFKKH